jgi:hypothetical protein
MPAASPAAHGLLRCGHEAGRPFRPTRSVGPVRFRQRRPAAERVGRRSVDLRDRAPGCPNRRGRRRDHHVAKLQAHRLRHARDGRLDRPDQRLPVRRGGLDHPLGRHRHRLLAAGPQGPAAAGGARTAGRDAAGNTGRPDARANRGQPVTGNRRAGLAPDGRRDLRLPWLAALLGRRDGLSGPLAGRCRGRSGPDAARAHRPSRRAACHAESKNSRRRPAAAQHGRGHRLLCRGQRRRSSGDPHRRW